MTSEVKIYIPKPICRNPNTQGIKYSKSIGCPSITNKTELLFNGNNKFTEFTNDTSKTPSISSLNYDKYNFSVNKNFISYEEFEYEINSDLSKQSATSEILSILSNENKSNKFKGNMNSSYILNSTNFDLESDLLEFNSYNIVKYKKLKEGIGKNLEIESLCNQSCTDDNYNYYNEFELENFENNNNDLVKCKSANNVENYNTGKSLISSNIPLRCKNPYSRFLTSKKSNKINNFSEDFQRVKFMDINLEKITSVSKLL